MYYNSVESGYFGFYRGIEMAKKNSQTALSENSEGLLVPFKNQDAPAESHWTFLSNHAHVLVALCKNPGLVLREVSFQVGITERAVQRIVDDLEDGGILVKEKVGRQNVYRINLQKPLRHPLEAHKTIGDLISMILKS